MSLKPTQAVNSSIEFQLSSQAVSQPKSKVTDVFRKNQKNLDFDKESPQNSCSEGAVIAERQDASARLSHKYAGRKKYAVS